MDFLSVICLLVLLALAGLIGVKTTRKRTPYAAAMAAKVVAKEAMNIDVSKVIVLVHGIGAEKERDSKGLAGDAETSGLEITLIRDHTRLPFNG